LAPWEGQITVSEKYVKIKKERNFNHGALVKRNGEARVVDFGTDKLAIGSDILFRCEHARDQLEVRIDEKRRKLRKKTSGKRKTMRCKDGCVTLFSKVAKDLALRGRKRRECEREDSMVLFGVGVLFVFFFFRTEQENWRLFPCVFVFEHNTQEVKC
jgi:hypothetical protein